MSDIERRVCKAIEASMACYCVITILESDVDMVDDLYATLRALSDGDASNRMHAEYWGHEGEDGEERVTWCVHVARAAALSRVDDA